VSIGKDKQKIIRQKGSNVLIHTLDEFPIETKSLIGRASTQFNSTLSLEAHRRGHFLPNINIQNGYLVEDILKKETYLCLANYSEIIDGSITSTVSHMAVCNGLITVVRKVETVDDRGKITKIDTEIVKDLKIYLESKKQELKQYDAGLYPNFDYIIHAPYFDISLLDSIEVNNGVQIIKLKVESFDAITYPGALVILASSETRR
jgi:hypothetical protein